MGGVERVFVMHVTVEELLWWMEEVTLYNVKVDPITMKCTLFIKHSAQSSATMLTNRFRLKPQVYP